MATMRAAYHPHPTWQGAVSGLLGIDVQRTFSHVAFGCSCAWLHPEQEQAEEEQ